MDTQKGVCTGFVGKLCPFCIGNINVVAFARHLYVISARLKLITQEKGNLQIQLIFRKAGCCTSGSACDLRLCLGGTGTKRLGVVVPVALVPRIDHDKPCFVWLRRWLFRRILLLLSRREYRFYMHRLIHGRRLFWHCFFLRRLRRYVRFLCFQLFRLPKDFVNQVFFRLFAAAACKRKKDSASDCKQEQLFNLFHFVLSR